MQYSFVVCTVCGYWLGGWHNNLPEKGHSETGVEFYKQASLLCVCCVCPHLREEELRVEWEGLGALKRKPRMDGKNGLQAKQSARQPITCLKAAAIPYKACTHKHWGRCVM